MREILNSNALPRAAIRSVWQNRINETGLWTELAVYPKSESDLQTFCLLVVIDNYYDYTLYGGADAGKYITDGLVTEIQNNLPSAEAYLDVAGVNRFLVWAKKCTFSAFRRFVENLRRAAAKIEVPCSLPGYLEKINLEFAVSISPPLPERYLMQSVILRYKEKHNFFKDFNFQVPSTEDQVYDLLAKRSCILGEFVRKTVALTDSICRRLFFDSQTAEDMHNAALWSDIGIVKLPLTVMLKPIPLTLTEKKTLESHVALSCRMAKLGGLNEQAIRLIADHHERWDGLGYPCGKKSGGVSENAQLLHLISNYVSLQTDYPWRQAVHGAAALEQLNCLVGKKYGAAVFEKFAAAVR